MCGFVGFFDTSLEKETILKNMMNRLIHRGPDMEGLYCDEEAALGFRRLSILDLSEAGAQPLYSEDGSKVLVFNGEIYNYIELREELIEKGYHFKSNTDSEVLIHGYVEYGEELLNKLRGMFAFCIWDKEKQSVFGARDFFGIKPYYFYEYECNGKQSLMVASEIKAFLEHPLFVKEVNEKALKPYLTFQYSSQTDETFFKGVKRLPPGHFFRYQKGKLEIKQYWEVNFQDEKRSLEENVKKIQEVVEDSVSIHKRSDVPLGAFLSGGIDSSYITACLMPDKTFSVGFQQDQFDETTMAEDLSKILGVENIKKTITGEECMEKLSEIQYYMDEPQSNPSTLPLYFLAKLVKDNGVTVVLSGEGADEIFGGYEWYDMDQGQRTLKKIPSPILRAAAEVAKHLPNFKGKTTLLRAGLPVEETFIGEALIFEEFESEKILKPKYRKGTGVKEITSRVYQKVKGKDDVTKKQFLDLKLFMEGDILQKADKMSMAHSLELRVPFLDKEVMKVAEGIGTEQKNYRRYHQICLARSGKRKDSQRMVSKDEKRISGSHSFLVHGREILSVCQRLFFFRFCRPLFQARGIAEFVRNPLSGKSKPCQKNLYRPCIFGLV